MRYLGQLVVANGVSVNNLSTIVPFRIPPGFRALKLTASGSDCYGYCSPGDNTQAATATTGTSLGTTEYTMTIDGAAGTGVNDKDNVLAVFNNNAASRNVAVFADEAQ